MKGGLAAYLVAAAAIAEPATTVAATCCSSVIEEECGGNGMWSVLRAGYEADAVLVGEPTGLRLGHAYTGVVWARLTSPGGTGTRCSPAARSVRPPLPGGRRAAQDRVGDQRARARPDLRRRARAAGMTVGRIEGGGRRRRSHEPVAQIRFGFGRDLEPAEVQARMRAAVEESSPEVEIAFEGFRARAYAHATNGPLVDAVSAAQRTARAGRSPSSWRSPRRPTHATSRSRASAQPDRRQPARHRRVGRRRVARADRDCGGARDRRVDGMSRRLDGGPPA